jgi:hypothetical protein
MEPWKVTVVDGEFGRYEGFAVVMAESLEAARAVTTEYLKNDHAYGKPLQISEIERHDTAVPYVAFFNWGEFPGGWPAQHDTPESPTA